MPHLTKDSSVLVVGGGAWGRSVALALGRAGYSSVTVVDPRPVPSPLSAATDVNKIVDGAVRGPENNAVQKALQLAVDRWRNDPVYAPFHQETGLLIAGSTPKAIEMLYEDDLHNIPNTVECSDAESFRNLLSAAYQGDFPGWKGFLDNNPGAGWVDSVGAVQSAASEAERLGATFTQGRIVNLLYDPASADVQGAITDQGIDLRADFTILCAGACSPQIMELRDEIHAVAWAIAHIQLEPSEVAALKDSPPLWSNNLGFIMPPSEQQTQLKVCDQHAGYVSRGMLNGRLQSIPFARDDIPIAAEQRIRRLLRETLPQMADREFSHTRMCWDADTVDGTFVLDRHPQHPSLIVAVGGSGLGVMHMPMIGEWVMAEMEKRLDPELADLWRMRPELSIDRDWRDCPHAWADPLDKREEIANETEWTSVGVPISWTSSHKDA